MTIRDVAPVARETSAVGGRATAALRRLAGAVLFSDGWRRRGIAFASGAVGALALAPLDFWPAVVVPMTAAVWLLDGAARVGPRGRPSVLRAMRQAFADGWFWGFGYFLAGLWWLGAPFLVPPGDFAWALPLGVVGLPALLAIFEALGFALAALLWSNRGWRVFALAGALGLAEYARGTLFTGFPWNLWGMALGGDLRLAQTASLVGAYGLTALAIALGAAPATLADPRPPGARPRAALVAVLTLVALYAFGAWRVSGPADATVAGVKLRLMQPDLTQDTAFVAANGDRILADYLKLSDRATSPTTSGIADATHLIWPESPFPFVLKDRPAATARIGAALAGRTILVTGAVRRGAFRSGDSAPRFFNAMQVVAADGAVVDSYDKVHLVPFGEYLPMAALLKRLGLTQMISVPGGFSAGSERRLLNVPGLPPVAPLICYEAIFPGAVVPPGPRPGLLLNVTDDAWFGDTPGPWQHFAQARLRAIEEGLPLVRDANTGVSAIVDGRGRITGLLGVGAKDVLDGGLPVAEAQTPFSRFGNLAAFALILSALVFATIGKFRN